MSPKLLALFYITIFAVYVHGKPIKNFHEKVQAHNQKAIEKAIQDNNVPCDVCVDFFDETLNEIINILLNLGVAGTCAEVCQQLEQQWEQALCMLVCFSVGFDIFVDVMTDSDVDPIHICVDFDMCPANNCQQNCTNITSVSVVPFSAPLRTTFTCNVELLVQQTVGTGITAVVIRTKGAPEIEYDMLNTGFQPGTYNFTIPIETDWEDWNYPTGSWTARVYSCAEDCENEHGVIWSMGTTTFQITN